MAKELAGKSAQFEVTLKRVEASVLPEVNAEFARQLGIGDGDLAKMRAEIRAQPGARGAAARAGAGKGPGDEGAAR